MADAAPSSSPDVWLTLLAVQAVDLPSDQVSRALIASGSESASKGTHANKWPIKDMIRSGDG